MKNADSSFARMLLRQAEADKKKDAMTKDVMKARRRVLLRVALCKGSPHAQRAQIIEWLEDATPSDDKEFEGKLKDHLPSFDKRSLNEICRDIPSEMPAMQPVREGGRGAELRATCGTDSARAQALRELIADLGTAGEAGLIIDIVYR